MKLNETGIHIIVWRPAQRIVFLKVYTPVYTYTSLYIHIYSMYIWDLRTVSMKSFSPCGGFVMTCTLSGPSAPLLTNLTCFSSSSPSFFSSYPGTSDVNVTTLRGPCQSTRPTFSHSLQEFCPAFSQSTEYPWLFGASQRR